MSARQPAARHPADPVLRQLTVNLPPDVVDGVDFWTGVGQFATESGCAEWIGRRAGDGAPVLRLVAREDPLSPSVQQLQRLRSQVAGFAEYLRGWSADHMAGVTDHEVAMMHRAGKELRRIVEGRPS